MAGSDFLLSMIMGAVLSWASYSIVAHMTLKRHISGLRIISWGILGTLSLGLSVCAFSAVGAEPPTASQGAVCSGNAPECYVKTHHNPVRECTQVMDKKASFHHVWLESEAPIFDAYLWQDESANIVQAFGQQAKAVNALGMLTPLQYFCIFNANTGEVIAASFE